MRLLGISIASFSSGPFNRTFYRLWLELTMAQVSVNSPSCNYPPPTLQPLQDAALGACF